MNSKQNKTTFFKFELETKFRFDEVRESARRQQIRKLIFRTTNQNRYTTVKIHIKTSTTDNNNATTTSSFNYATNTNYTTTNVTNAITNSSNSTTKGSHKRQIWRQSIIERFYEFPMIHKFYLLRFQDLPLSVPFRRSIVSIRPLI